MPNTTLLDAKALDWIDRHGLLPNGPDHPDWGFKLAMSTVPTSDWIVRRSKLAASELWFGLGLSFATGWRAQLTTRDDSLKLTWRPDRQVEVESLSVLNRSKVSWPEFAELDQLPELILSLETLLQRKFLRSVEFSAPSLKSKDFAPLISWLSPVCGEVNFVLGNLYGELPEGSEVDDDDQSESGLTVRMRIPGNGATLKPET
jgi:hypothetical protein